MTRYGDDELAGDWEFKIVRSATGKFGNPEALQRMLEEESVAGWVLLEKFDDNRVRLKRPRSAAAGDLMLPQGVDPYRTQYGTAEIAVAAIVVAVILLVTIAISGMIAYFSAR